MKYFACLIAIAIIVNLSFSEPSHAELIVTEDSHSLSDELYWLKTQASLTVEDVAEFPLDRFEKPLGRDFGDGYNTSHYWFRFDFDFTAAKEGKWLLEIPFALLDQVILFEPLKEGGFNKIETGDRRPFHDRAMPLHNFVFPLNIHSNQQTYFLYVQTQDSVQVPMALWSESEYLPQYGFDLSIQMAFFGAMLVMMIYNFFIYLSTRDSNYILYVAFIALMIFFQMGLQGFSHQMLWPNYPWWSNISTALFGVLSLFFGLLFVKKLLNTKEHIPKFDKVLTVVSYTMLLSILLILFGDYNLSIYASLISTSVFFNLALVAIILLVLKGNRTAKIVLAAWSIFLISGSLSMLGILGVIPLEIGNTHTLQIGSSFEVVLLSFALADRIKILRQEKLDVEVMSADILRVSNEQLERSNHIKDAFIATISHEIKTPMNAILGSSQLLKEETLNTDQRQYVDVIERSGNSLIVILDNILEYSKLEAGRVVSVERETDVIGLFEDVTSLFDFQLKQKGVRLWLTYSDGLSEKIYIDDILLKHVVMNLISNSVKFTRQGFIWVHVSISPSKQLKIEVTDSGIGMNQAQMDKIFGAFIQANDTTSREYGGTGLGLVITRKICELLEGRVNVDSIEGVGTTFTVEVSMEEISGTLRHSELPLINQVKLGKERDLINTRFIFNPNNNAASLTSSDQASLVVSHNNNHEILSGVLSQKSLLKACGVVKKTNTIIEKSSDDVMLKPLKKVLAVDDDLTNRMVIDKILSRLNVDYAVVESGDKAIQAIKNNGYDIVLMDIEMPAKDGYETTKEIRLLEQTTGSTPLKVVALSAHTAIEFKEKALLSGMDDFFSKPVKISDLKALFESL